MYSGGISVLLPSLLPPADDGGPLDIPPDGGYVGAIVGACVCVWANATVAADATCVSVRGVHA